MDTDPTPSPTPPPDSNPEPQRRWLILLMGIVLGDLVIGLQFGITLLLKDKVALVRTLGLPSLFLVPVLGGLITSYIWRTVKPTIGLTIVNSLWMTVLALAVGVAVFHEGAICLLILSPVFFVSVLTGALVGRVLFKTDPTKLQVSLLPLLALLVAAEPMVRTQRQNAVTDEILIHAPPEKVWPQLTSFRKISTTPGFWLFRIGLPYPESTTSAGDFINADRECIFSHDAIFKEKVVELIPGQNLTFDIIESPQDPELIGHLTPHRGQFLLRSNADGTTTLIGTTWYTLHVRPLWYFDLWTHHIFRAVHLRVMEDIRRRAESSP
jgi:hypothetical protein